MNDLDGNIVITSKGKVVDKRTVNNQVRTFKVIEYIDVGYVNPRAIKKLYKNTIIE